MTTPRGELMSGPRCRTCTQSEARCAWLGGACCAGCSHWIAFDANGNEAPSPIAHGTDSGFHKHRYRGELPCGPCRLAHSRHVNARKAVAS